MKKLFFAFFVLLFTSAPLIGKARAAAPVSVSLFNPVQTVSENDDIRGLRFNLIYGVNDDISGVDLGLVNQSDGMQKGFQFGLFNNTSDFYGLQLGLINKTVWLEGIQIGLINIHEEGERGFFPLVNWAF